MKKSLLATALLFLAIVMFGCTNASSCSGEESTDEQYQEMILTLANAFSKYSEVMPIIGQDTESTWAVGEVKSEVGKLAKRKFSIEEGISRLYMIEAYTAYGLTYQRAILGSYSKESENAGYAMYMIKTMKEKFDSIKKGGFKDIRMICELGAYAHFYSQLFAKLYNATEQEKVFSENAFGCSLEFQGMVNSLAEDGVTGRDLLQAQAVFDGVSFFHAYCPLIQGFSMSKEVYGSQEGVIIEAANYFDRYYNKLIKDLTKGSSQKPAVDNLEDYAKKALEYQTTLLGYLTENIKSIEKAQ